MVQRPPIARHKDDQRYGDYRTKRLIMEAWERVGALVGWAKECAWEIHKFAYFVTGG